MLAAGEAGRVAGKAALVSAKENALGCSIGKGRRGRSAGEVKL
jgi:hypothetical protein